jgi:general nucleoside transport system ATP-binding protein
MPVPPAELVTMMFQAPIQVAEREAVTLGDTVLSLRDAGVEERLMRLAGISLDVRAGEVIGLAGMEGSGQRVFLRGICGLTAPSHGQVVVDGIDVTAMGYRGHLDRGIHYLPAGRLEEGLVEGLTISEHFVLSDRSDTSLLIDRDAAATRARVLVEQYSIKGEADSPVESLSGGNQQRLLLAMLPPNLRLLLMEHPTRGLDLESADWVWGQLLARRDDGTAIVFASADLDELLRYSDRILVFFSGQVLAVLDASATDHDQIGHLIGGRTSSAGAVDR